MSETPITMLKIDNRSLSSDLDRAGYKKMGVFVKQADRYSEVIEVLNHGKIDIILLNLDIDDFDALALIKSLRSQAPYREIPIMVTSVQNKVSQRKAALDAGAELFIEQPFPRQYLFEKIKGLLAKEVRTEERVNTEESVIMFSIKNKEYVCTIGDISTSGVLVITDLDLKPGEPLELRLRLPGFKNDLKINGQIVRMVQDRNSSLGGFGVRFVDFRGDAKKRLEKYIAKSSIRDVNMAYYL